MAVTTKPFHALEGFDSHGLLDACVSFSGCIWAANMVSDESGHRLLCALIPVVPALPYHSQKPPFGGNRGNKWVRVGSSRG